MTTNFSISTFSSASSTKGAPQIATRSPTGLNTSKLRDLWRKSNDYIVINVSGKGRSKLRGRTCSRKQNEMEVEVESDGRGKREGYPIIKGSMEVKELDCEVTVEGTKRN